MSFVFCHNTDDITDGRIVKTRGSQDMATISEGINWLKTLQTRHQELIQLRDNNARLIVTRNMALNTSEEQKPTYDAKTLDRRITLLAREIRLCNDGIK